MEKSGETWKVKATPLETLFSQHVFSFYQRQIHLAETVGNLDWRLRVNDEMLDFGKRTFGLFFKQAVSFKVQLIGTESYITDTWRWGWSNKKGTSNFASWSHKILEMGHSQGIEDFVADEIELNGFAQPTGDDMAAMGAAILDLALFRCPHTTGAVWVGLMNFHPEQNNPNLANVAKIIDEGVRRYTIMNQPHAILSYAKQLKLDTEIDFPNIKLISLNGIVEVILDQQGWVYTARSNLYNAQI
jgi:hypothetical protein